MNRTIPCAAACIALASLSVHATLPSMSEADRDALIARLLERVEALERRLAEKDAAAAPAAPADTPPLPARQDAGEASVEGPRALERALVREGGLVLPPKAFEVETGLAYEHRSFRGLELFGAAVSLQYATRDALEGALALRAGLPGAAQVELSVPYASVHDRRSIPGVRQDEERWSGVGNVGVGITKQFAGERPGRPGVLGSLYWRDAAPGADAATAGALASGFPSVQAAITLVKRSDPLVFYGGISHALNRPRSFDARRIDPGDTTGLRFGGILALSPDVSMRLGMDLSRTRDATVEGERRFGSNATVALLEGGFGIRLSPSTLLGVNAGVGLTARSPDFRLSITLPIRF